MSDFETYRKRQLRVKKLEQLYWTTKKLILAINRQDSDDAALAIEQLSDLCAEIEKLPGPDMTIQN